MTRSFGPGLFDPKGEKKNICMRLRYLDEKIGGLERRWGGGVWKRPPQRGRELQDTGVRKRVSTCEPTWERAIVFLAVVLELSRASGGVGFPRGLRKTEIEWRP